MENPFNNEMNYIEAQLTYFRFAKGKGKEERAQLKKYYSETLSVISKRETAEIANGLCTEYTI